VKATRKNLEYIIDFKFGMKVDVYFASHSNAAGMVEQVVLNKPPIRGSITTSLKQIEGNKRARGLY
jgi:hypothetical protein